MPAPQRKKWEAVEDEGVGDCQLERVVGWRKALLVRQQPRNPPQRKPDLHLHYFCREHEASSALQRETEARLDHSPALAVPMPRARGCPQQARAAQVQEAEGAENPSTRGAPQAPQLSSPLPIAPLRSVPRLSGSGSGEAPGHRGSGVPLQSPARCRPQTAQCRDCQLEQRGDAGFGLAHPMRNPT